jgi:hypothetical protein
MEKWSMFRRQAWKIDHRWSEHGLLVHAERLKGDGIWAPLTQAAKAEVFLIDMCVADLVGCLVAREDWDRDYWARVERSLGNRELFDLDIASEWGDERNQADEADRRWEEKSNAAREREGDLLLMHYLLPHVRLSRKQRVLQLSERAYYYRLNSALDTLSDEYSFRAKHINMCSRKYL